MALDEERQGSGEERPERDRPAGGERLARPLDPAPQIGDGADRQDQYRDRRDHPVPGQPHRSPADRAEQRQAHRRRQPRPAPSPAEAIAACPIVSEDAQIASTAA